MAQRVRKAVFPVGGMGTRFLPATKAVPKEMLPVVDKPLIQYAVEEALAAGIEEFIFVTGRGKGAIEDHFDHNIELQKFLASRGKNEEALNFGLTKLKPGQVVYVRQQSPLGLGHAVWCARDLVGNEPFAVLLADDFVIAEPACLKQMIDVFDHTKGNIVATMEVPLEQTRRYGILEVEGEEGPLVKIVGLVEKPPSAEAKSRLAVIGRYILLPEIFSHLEKKVVGADKEIQLTDAIAMMIGRLPFHGMRFQGKRFDCGNKVEFLEANLAVALTREDLSDEVSSFIKRYIK
mgnify:CR=1 FL=1